MFSKDVLSRKDDYAEARLPQIPSKSHIRDVKNRGNREIAGKGSVEVRA